jgi:hypothetical protein
MNAPDVTGKAIEHALTPDGHQDRELVLRIAGAVPAPTQPKVTFGYHRRHLKPWSNHSGQTWSYSSKAAQRTGQAPFQISSKE